MQLYYLIYLIDYLDNHVRLCYRSFGMVNKQGTPSYAVYEIDPDQPVYVIGVASQLTKLPIWTLRVLDREGIVKAKRSEGQTRLYSLNHVRRLMHIHGLMVEQGVNVQGVRVILRMETRTEYY